MKPEELFASVFEPALFEQVLKSGKQMTLHEGKPFLQLGDVVRNIPLVLEGKLKVTRMDEEGKEILLYYIHPGESCAMTFTCCMQQFPSEVQMTAEESTVLLSVPMKFMDEWLETYPTWKSFVMKSIRIRFNELLKTISQLAFHKLDERLVIYLKEKSRVSNSSLINISHEQIAQEMATSRVVISRLLKALENDGKLLLYRNQIKLLSGF